MKSLKTIVTVLSIAALSSCAANFQNQKATVVGDCTGKYLRIAGKDYQVCNTDLLNNFKNGSTVTATFEKIKNCPEFEGKISCMMYHPNEGIIRIKSIK